MVNKVSSPIRGLAVYGRQQYYADRSKELKTPKTIQIGTADKIDISSEGAKISNNVASFVGPNLTVETQKIVRSQTKQITYEDPRRGKEKSKSALTGSVSTPGGFVESGRAGTRSLSYLGL
jgi:hypothetical protein